MDEPAQWKAVGNRLRDAREAMQPKVGKREAARRAGFSDITWRNLERGERQIGAGQWIPMQASNQVLVAAARAVAIDPRELFEILDRPYEPGPDLEAATTKPMGSVDQRLTQVENRLNRIEAQQDRALELLEALVEREGQ